MTTLHQLLIDAAAQWPDRVAVAHPARSKQVTYRDLVGRSGELAEQLLSIGIRPGDRVGLCLPKSIGAVAAIFGVLGAGASYVPVDRGSPLSRIATIFRDCGVRAILVERARCDELAAELGLDNAMFAEPSGLSDLGDDLVLLDVGAPDGEVEPPAGLAYILYTSGSTGVPKGVMHSNASALAFVDWCSETFAPMPEDRFSSHAPFHFDLSIFDLFVPIRHGATIVLIGEEEGRQPSRLAEIMAAERISVWYSTPSVLRLVMDGIGNGECAMPDLRVVNFAGEVFPTRHLARLVAMLPGPRYFNLYGPTETNVCTCHEVRPHDLADIDRPIPIGRPASSDRCRVVTDGEAVANGERGELEVAGGSVMLGYWNAAEHGANVFSVDPDGTRWYRTGDIVVERDDGYVFLGRRDRMVKRRGFRIELGEIEMALLRHPDIEEAAVVAGASPEDDVIITAFVVWRGVAKPSMIAVKAHCAATLPRHFIPDGIVFRDGLPMTSTDKIDYQRLKVLA